MVNIVADDPFAGTALDDVFRGFFAPVRLEGTRTPVTIRMDVTETPEGFLIHAEMPGVKKDDINVEIDGNQVTLAAEVRREREKKNGDKRLCTERYYGNVYRTFTLPAALDATASVARYADGLLELTLVRRAATAGRKLPVL